MIKSIIFIYGFLAALLNTMIPIYFIMGVIVRSINNVFREREN